MQYAKIGVYFSWVRAVKMLTGLNHITLATKDISESIEFYISLGFEAHVRWGSGAYLTLQDLWLCLSKGNVDHKTDYIHISYSVEESNFDELRSNLLKKSIKEWQENMSEGKSMYLLDPSGHKLEVHVGSLTSRLNELKDKPYKGMEWLK